MQVCVQSMMGCKSVSRCDMRTQQQQYNIQQQPPRSAGTTSLQRLAASAYTLIEPHITNYPSNC
jgi:hypothetical protein